MRPIRILCGTACALWLVTAGSGHAQPLVGIVTINGQTAVSWRGEEVFAGPTEGPVRGLSASIGREEFAAALDGNKILWENVPGAAQKVKNALRASAGSEKKSAPGSKVPLRRLTPPTSSGLCISTADGLTTVVWEGKQAFIGPTKGQVTGKVKTGLGTEFAAVFEDGKVLWQSEKGAAERVK